MMKYPLQYLVALSLVDRKQDDLEDEYGDLPERIQEMKEKYEELESFVKETQRILEEDRLFIMNSKKALEELKAREERLSKQQFLVRNNKEFDAITREIEYARNEHARISQELQQAKVKEENLVVILEQQKKSAEEALKELRELEKDYELIATNQNEELNEIKMARMKIIERLDKYPLELYNRIRNSHKDAIVKVKKNSCTGCFSHIPPQKIVEIRNNLDKLYTCENCGRILYPEDLEIDSEFIL
ncbi:MAG: C4-type zinc ribbon domain-containing protein [Ignavibacteria bacterium]|nr:C4-type zinc ribbon domain-containing protein [Ignavibacteria bacterium]